MIWSGWVLSDFFSIVKHPGSIGDGPPGHQGSHRLERLWGKASLTAGARRFEGPRRPRHQFQHEGWVGPSCFFLFIFFSNKIHRFWWYFFIIGCCLGYFLGAFLLDISCPFCFAHSSIRAGLLDESIVWDLSSPAKWLHWQMSLLEILHHFFDNLRLEIFRY